MRETWYVLEDDSVVRPSECSLDKSGRLAHKNGLVAMRNDGETPRSRGVDVDDAGHQPFGGKGDHDGNGSTGGAKKPRPKKTEDMQPEPQPRPAKKPGYKTRGK